MFSLCRRSTKSYEKQHTSKRPPPSPYHTGRPPRITHPSPPPTSYTLPSAHPTHTHIQFHSHFSRRRDHNHNSPYTYFLYSNCTARQRAAKFLISVSFSLLRKRRNSNIHGLFRSLSGSLPFLCNT